jgi:hypothetical protein
LFANDWLEMAGNGWKWLEILDADLRQLKQASLDGIDQSRCCGHRCALCSDMVRPYFDRWSSAFICCKNYFSTETAA